MRTAYFAGGCFWCIAPTFRSLAGVTGVTSGYSGGEEENPAYEDVKGQRTGHRETVAIGYDEGQVSFDTLLSVFLRNIDPFDGGGQFIDRGRSYSPAVYFTHEDEREIALGRLKALEERTGKAPQVAVEPFKSFWPAEDYHQDWDLKHPSAFLEELMTSGRRKQG